MLSSVVLFLLLRYLLIIYILLRIQRWNSWTSNNKRLESFDPCYHRVGRMLSFFSSRRNWPPTPLAAGECAPQPFGPGGGAHCLRERGWGSPNSDEGTYTVVLYIYKYFVHAIHSSFYWRILKKKTILYSSLEKSAKQENKKTRVYSLE